MKGSIKGKILDHVEAWISELFWSRIRGVPCVLRGCSCGSLGSVQRCSGAYGKGRTLRDVRDLPRTVARKRLCGSLIPSRQPGEGESTETALVLVDFRVARPGSIIVGYGYLVHTISSNKPDTVFTL